MILSFRDPETEKIFLNQVSRRFPADIQRTALRKLLYLNAALSLHGLSVPPGNRLELLKGNRSGQHSIRINNQWRICFIWQDAEPERNIPYGVLNVEIVDYH